MDPDKLTPLEVVEGLAKGSLVYKLHGRIMPTKLSASEQAALEEAKSLGFVKVRGNRSNLSNIWFDYCNVIDWPYVVLKETPKFAKIQMDLIEYGRRLTSEGTKQLYQELHAISARVKQWTHGATGIATVGCIFSEITRVPHEVGEKIARAMVDFARKNAVSNEDPRE